VGGAATRLSDRGLSRSEYLVALFAVALLIYLISPVVTSSDAKFAMHVALSLYKGRPGELTPWLPAIHATKQYQLYGFPYQLVTTAAGIYSLYPIGAPLMVVTYVAANDGLGGHLISSLEQNIAPWHDHIAASIISAAAIAVLYLAMRRREASVTGALLATAAFALGRTGLDRDRRCAAAHELARRLRARARRHSILARERRL
jgi:hypothetical protein